jgi:hypothetical protein
MSIYWSPSGLELWNLCNARALGKYVAGVVEPDSPQANEGTRLHRLTQEAMVTGKLPPPNEVAVHKIVAALPIPLGTIQRRNIERVVLLPGVNSFKDWTTDDGRHGDLKFTGDVSYQRAKDPMKDPQRLVYAADEFWRDPWLRRTTQTWSVAQFNGARAIKLDMVWTRNSLKNAIEKNLAKPLDKFVEAVQSKQDWMTAAKNYGACDMYRPNGCPMKGLGCRPSLRERLVQIQPKPKKVKK